VLLNLQLSVELFCLVHDRLYTYFRTVWFKGTSYILAHHLCALLLPSLIILCYCNSFIMLCCAICIAFFLFRFPFMSSPVIPFHSGAGGGGLVEPKLRSTQIRVQGTFLNSTTRLRVRVPLRKVCAIILVLCSTRNLPWDERSPEVHD
jgi:hypothetical protein